MKFLEISLFLVSGVCLTLSIVPKFLPCDDLQNDSIVICSERHLKHVPRIQSPSVTSLDLTTNEIRRLTNFSFCGVPNLITLDVSNNCLPSDLRPDKENCMLTIESGALVNLKNLKSLNLSGNSLTTIPPLPENISTLNLNLNHILVVSEVELAGLTNLIFLQIGWNCYYLNTCERPLNFSANALRNIRYLDLSFNSLIFVPSSLPASLLNLSLAENNISKVDREDLCHLINLQSLDLQWNGQRCDHAAQPCFPCIDGRALELGPGAFDCLHNLYYLSLRGNSLRTINGSLFTHLNKLRTLDLSDNYLDFEVETFFSELTNLQTLKLDFNFKPSGMHKRLIFNSSVAKMKSLRQISVAGYFFDVLDEEGIKPLLGLSDLSKISLRTNFIRQANMRILLANTNLSAVSFSENLITFQMACTALDHRTEITPPILLRVDKPDPVGVSNDGLLRNAEVNLRECWQYTRSLDLSFNNIGSLHQDDFLGMEYIECLNMSFNYINQQLNGSQFKHLKSLRHLDLSHNRFDLYHFKALNELPKLKILNLEHNEYQFMMRGVNHRLNFLENLISLTELNLNYNLIGLCITEELKNPSLEKLLFTNNELRSSWQFGNKTYGNMFTNLKSLKLLDISYNQLIVIPHGVLENLPESLQNLNISNNELYSFHWDKIAHLGNLTSLDLSFNSLTVLYRNTTIMSSSIWFLSLQSNKISSLNKEFFNSYSELKTLILSDNLIQNIDVSSFPKRLLQTLDHLDVSGNPFRCTCEANWLITYLMETQIIIDHFSTGMTCDSPDGLRGKHLLSMDPQSCQDLYGYQCFICSSLLVIIWMVITIIWKLFSWDLWYILQVAVASIRSYSRLPADDKAEFDAFIVFNTKDNAVREWVYYELLAQLEGPERGTFNLCLEERDWIAGKSTIENLYEAIYRSKKTIFIMTQEGFNCGILHHAFFMSHQRLLDEKQDVMILVILDQKMKMSRYLLTRRRLCPKSFLNWPHNPKAHAHFWYRLRVLLRQDGRKSYVPSLRKHIDR
ncbi:toll-like receptor 7 [Pelodytes ibericus]